jgi:hypothetical protein
MLNKEPKSVFKDTLIGLKPASFPWFLSKNTFKDRQGDSWTLEVSCAQIEPSIRKDHVMATFHIKGKSRLSKQTLDRLGIEGTRLDQLGIEEWNFVNTKDEWVVEAKMDDLYLLGDRFLSKVQQKLESLDSLSIKEEQVRSHIKNLRLSHLTML